VKLPEQRIGNGPLKMEENMEPRKDVEFETVKAEEIKFGKNNFLEVARKKAVTGEGENEFIAISRGFFLPDGTKRFRRSLALPDDVIDFVVDKLKEMREKPKKEKKEAKKEDKEEKPKEAETPEEAK